MAGGPPRRNPCLRKRRRPAPPRARPCDRASSFTTSFGPARLPGNTTLMRRLLDDGTLGRPKMDPLFGKYGLQSESLKLQRHTLPAIALSLVQRRSGRSIFGGAPLVPSNYEWPSYRPPPRNYPPALMEKFGLSAALDPVPRALDFLLQIDLAELRPLDVEHDLPQRGLLTFFYDCENQPWGYDPAHQEGFRVVLFEGDDLTSRLPPNRPLESRGLEFSRAETLPHIGSRAYEKLAKEVTLTREYFEFVHDFERRAYGREGGLHRLFGHSANVQGDMQLEAQLVSNGLYCGGPSGYSNARAKALEAGTQDWILLLQLDSDDGAEIMWGDLGMLYFWIRRQDLATGRFDRAWLALQCG